jgi:hypothetical protein
MANRATFAPAALVVALGALPTAPLHAQLGAAGNRLISALDFTVVTSETNAGFGSTVAAADFDGDGKDDLAIGIPGASVGTAARAGKVVVTYAAASLTALGGQEWHQSIAGVGEVAEADDTFGDALATGDFDGDGFADLVIAATGERLSTYSGAGVVHVIHGSATGLDATREVTYTRTIAPGSLEAYARFGTAFAVGDFDSDGFDDLAIGAPGETVNGAPRAGVVVTVYGSATGLDPAGAQRWTQWQLGAVNGEDDSEAHDNFGFALASGDFDGDGYDDLAAGAPGEDLPSTANCGAVNILRGNPAGLLATGTTWLQAASGWRNVGDHYGSALVALDFDGNGSDDLAVGAPDYDRPEADSGVVFLVLSSPGTGITTSSWFTAHDQRSTGAASEAGDRVGATLAAGDLDGDGYDDLIFGAPTEDIGTMADAGAISVIPGYAAGSAGGKTWHQDSPGVSGTAEPNDFLGSSIAVGRFSGESLDLAIGVPGEGWGTTQAAGAVLLLRIRQVFTDGFESGTTAAWN